MSWVDLIFTTSLTLYGSFKLTNHLLLKYAFRGEINRKAVLELYKNLKKYPSDELKCLVIRKTDSQDRER